MLTLSGLQTGTGSAVKVQN